MDLTEPTDHTDGYTWAAALVSHAAIGMVLAFEGVAFMPFWLAVTGAWAGYLLFWEGLIQKLGAGLLDALVDAAAVAAGVTYAAGLMLDFPHVRWAALALFALALSGGVWRRRNVG